MVRISQKNSIGNNIKKIEIKEVCFLSVESFVSAENKLLTNITKKILNIFKIFFIRNVSTLYIYHLFIYPQLIQSLYLFIN